MLSKHIYIAGDWKSKSLITQQATKDHLLTGDACVSKNTTTQLVNRGVFYVCSTTGCTLLN